MSDIIPAAPLPPKIPVQIEDETVLDADAIEALERQGFVDLPKRSLQDLRTIGIHIHQLGTIRTQRGRAVVSQQRLELTLRALYCELEDLSKDKNRKGRIKEMLGITQQIGYLTGKMVDSQTLLVLMEGGHAAITPDGLADNVIPSFRAGAQVSPSNTLVITQDAHFHQQPPSNPR